MKLNKSKCKACSQHCSKIDKSKSTNVSPILLRRIQCIRYATWRFSHTLNSKHSAKTKIKTRQDISVIANHTQDFFFSTTFFLSHLFFFFFSVTVESVLLSLQPM